MNKKISGRCLIVFLIIMALLSFGAIWLVSKVSTMRQEKIEHKDNAGTTRNITEQEWRAIGESLLSEYQGKILTILQINSSICRAALSPELSEAEAVKMAKNIGNHIRNATAGINAPSVQVFINGKPVAFARPDGSDYISEINR